MAKRWARREDVASRAQAIADNYINGNITDAKRQLRRANKRTVLEVSEILGAEKVIGLLGRD